MDTLPQSSKAEDFTNKIWHCDALELLKALPDKSVDMILTSPPYDNLRTYKGFTWDFESIAQESFRVLKDGGVLVWVVGDAVVNGSETLTSFRQALYFVDTCGFKMHDTMIYQKEAFPFPNATHYLQCFEYMFVLSKGVPAKYNLLKERINKNSGTKITGSNRNQDGLLSKLHGEKKNKTFEKYGLYSNVWNIDVGFMKTTKDVEAYEHPAMFPEELARRHILTWSDSGDIVMDYFSGSGTTAKIASNLDRKFIACDISQEYCELARERLNRNNGLSYTTSTGEKQMSLFEKED